QSPIYENTPRHLHCHLRPGTRRRLPDQRRQVGRRNQRHHARRNFCGRRSDFHQPVDLDRARHPARLLPAQPRRALVGRPDLRHPGVGLRLRPERADVEIPARRTRLAAAVGRDDGDLRGRRPRLTHRTADGDGNTDGGGGRGMKTWLLLGALVVFSSLGEILSSRGMKQVGHISFRPGHLFESIARAVRNPSLIASIVCLAFAFFSFLALLSYADLSFVIPLTAVTYLTNTLGAKLWLKEKITTARLAGTLMVTFGVVIVTLPQNFEATIISSVNGFFQNLIAALTGGEMLSAATPLTGWLLFALRAALLVCVIAAVVYYGISLVAGWLWSRDRRRQRALGTDFTPPVTILIPVRGADHNTHENFASFCRQDYPEFQIVFGVREADDPAVRVIRKLQGDFPARQIELVISPTEIGYNAKVSNLQNMYARAGHDLLIIVDSDIRVGPDYLRRVVAPMRRPGVGMVTCLYRGAGAETAAALVENIGISSTFSAEVVTARALEGIRFALGSTILTRRELLEKIGGFHAVADYLADDFLLGNYAAE